MTDEETAIAIKEAVEKERLRCADLLDTVAELMIVGRDLKMIIRGYATLIRFGSTKEAVVAMKDRFMK